MKKLNTSPISGMQELLPAQQAIFDNLKEEIARVYHLHGFQSIETPVIDRTDILLAKAGGDTEKQIYKVVKTAETADDADQALRFDHTVPLARYVVEHENDLAFPFRVTQIGRNFRGERAQKGRFREFYQLDVDVIGRGSLPVAYDAEIIATAVDALSRFIKPKFVVRVSNRKILTGLLRTLGLTEKFPIISDIIDHAEKVPIEKTLAALEEDAGLSTGQASLIEDFIFIKGSRAEVIPRLREGIDTKGAEFDPLYIEGVNELDEVLKILEAQGIKNAIADMIIIRGLDYYTGSVFETIIPEYKQIGSICSGGRYDNLAGHYTDQLLPGVGISIGLTRLFYVLNENKLLADVAEKKPIDVAIVPISENEFEFALKLANNLRAAGRSTDVILTNKRLGDKMTHAAKIANFAAVVGEDEVKSGEVTVKNLATGEKLSLADFLK